MADKNTRVGEERLGRPVDELVTGRAPGAGDRPGDYSASELAGRTPGATPARQVGGTGTTAGRDRNTGRDTEEDARGRERELRAEIEATREDMSETVEAIQDRLRPSHIASNAAESIKEAAADRTRDLVESEPVQYARANPIPTVMVGIGLAGVAWLAFRGREADDYRGGRSRGRGTGSYGDYPRSGRAYGVYGRDRYARDDEHDAWDRDERGVSGRDSGERVADRAGEMADDVRRRAEQATRRARQQGRRAQASLQRTWNENPFLIGASAAVLGALVGMAVPESEVENEWMGERRDRMIESAQEAVREKVDEVQDAATRAAAQVKEAVGITDKAEG